MMISGPRRMPDALSEAQWLIVQKALSCVGRMKGEHALARVVETLLGVASGYAAEHALDRLSTFGLLRGSNPDEVRLVLEALVRAGCATLSDDGEDLIALTAKGLRVARKEEPGFTLLWPRCAHETPLSFAQRIANERKAAARAEARPKFGRRPEEHSPRVASAEDLALAAELRTWRKGVAAELGIPAFRIMTNKTLEALVAERPASRAALSSIRGIYRQTCEDYGDDLLEIIGGLS